MSVNLARLRKRAAEFEQKKQFDKALEVYVQILDEGGKDLGDEDVPLFNRVGDMLMRKGSVTDALGYYERAVDMYAERGYLNNAIALCSKILRQSPGRAQVYYKLARISARKGFKSDARKNFLEYADRMQKLGMADEAFRALKEFASLYPDQDDVRLVLAELLSKENRKGEAIEQLQSLYEKLQSEGRSAEARATVDRMRAIDPSATPREGTESQSSAPTGDLIFLDLSDAEPPRATPSTEPSQSPVSARAPAPTPVPALTGLSITFFPDEDAPRPAGFESTAVEQEPVETTPVTRSLTPGGELVIEPVTEAVDAPDEIELVAETPPELEAAHPELEQIDPLELIAHEPEHLERVEDALDHLLPDVTEPAAEEPEAPSRYQTPMTSFEFADLELDDAPQEPPQREHDFALPGHLPSTPTSVNVDDELATIAEDVSPAFVPSVPTPVTVPTVSVPSPASDAAVEDARAAAEEMADLVADVAAREAAHVPQSRTPVSPPVEADLPDEAVPGVPEPAAIAPVEEAPADLPLLPSLDADGGAVPDDFMSMPPSFGSPTDPSDDHAFPPLFGLDEAQTPAEVPAAEVPTPRATISIGSAEGHLRRRLEIEPENWDLRRQLGEALLDTGDRDGGLYELELAMVGYEMRGDMDRAQEVVDEILGVVPGSVAHHQKRVEYAVRTRDRSRLANSYLELADALFRTGAADKAVAVYSRVLELDHGNERAEFALATLAPDDLVRLRGVPARPDRWTDELATIEKPQPAAEESAPAIAVPDESPAQVEVPTEDLVGAAESEPPRVRFASLELPVPEWDEGASQPDPETLELAPVTDAGQLSDDAPRAEASSTQESAIAPEAIDVPVARTATPLSAPTIRTPTPLTQPVFRPPTPVSSPVPRDPTPKSSPARRAPTPVPSARPVTPMAAPALAGSDNDFVDLGDWLRATEPVRSTRMQVADPKPTGDEQADFEEMLRRFKRGVAENVEAEDYDAHYDLGVAYKEMGLVDEAIAQFQKALRGTSHRVRSYEALGQCFVEKAQYPIAAALLQRATEVPGSDDQQLVGVLYLLGFSMEHLGRPAEALPYYLRVFAVDIEFRDIAERVAALGKTTT